MKNIILFFLFQFLAGQLSAQELDWFALNDCADIITSNFMEVDPEGNVYVVGQYQGETFFHSATEEGPERHTYTNTSWKRTFLIKYDNEGNLLFFINMYGTNSNGRYAEPRSFIRLKDGRLALAIYTDIGIWLKDAEGVEHTAKGRQQMMLLLFSKEGELLSVTPLALENAKKMLEDSNGKIYFQGKAKSYNREITAIFSLEPGENELQRLPSPDTAVADFILMRDRVWFLTRSEIKNRWSIVSQSFYLYETQPGDSLNPYFKHFSQTYSGHQSSIVYLVEQMGEVEVALQIYKQEKASLKLGEFTADLFKQNGFFIYHSNGQLKGRMDLNNAASSHFRIEGRENGGYLGTVYARNNFFIQGLDSVQVKPQPNYGWERFIMTFDQYMQAESSFSTNSSFLQQKGCFPRELNGDIYLVAKLVNYGEFGGVYKELSWKSGIYVARFKRRK